MKIELEKEEVELIKELLLIHKNSFMIYHDKPLRGGKEFNSKKFLLVMKTLSKFTE